MQPTPEEQILLSQWQKGNPKALSVLYDRYSGALYGVVLRICKNEAIAQDVLQETFITIWKKASNYDPQKGRFYTWAYRIARNKALNALRKEKDLIQNDNLSVHIENEDSTMELLGLYSINGALATLEPHHQKALQLIYFQGLTHREAHEVMKVPLGTFKSYVQQAMKQLREIYKTAPLLVYWCLEQIL